MNNRSCDKIMRKWTWVRKLANNEQEPTELTNTMIKWTVEWKTVRTKEYIYVNAISRREVM